MAQYINKNAVVAEIEKLRKEWSFGYSAEAKYRVEVYKELIDFLNTLEVKEVDFEKELDNYTKNILACDIQLAPFTHLYNCAKHFFELGMKEIIEQFERETGYELEVNNGKPFYSGWLNLRGTGITSLPEG